MVKQQVIANNVYRKVTEYRSFEVNAQYIYQTFYNMFYNEFRNW